MNAPTLGDGLRALRDAPTWLAAGHWLHRRAWDPRDLHVDLTGRVCVVTGGSQGIGLGITHGLASRGATVIVVCRDARRGELARQGLAGRDRVVVESADVSSVASVRDLADRIADRTDRVDVLVNNAGAVFDAPARSVDGHELTFATNVLGAFHLTALLAPLLRAAAPSRVVHVGSAAQYTQRLDVDALLRVAWPWVGAVAYARSKRALAELSARWAERLATSVTSNCMHPGLTATPGTSRSFPRYHRALSSALRDVDQGADTALWLAASPAAAGVNGGAFFDRVARPLDVVAWTRSDPREVDRLWDECASRCGLDPEAVGR